MNTISTKFKIMAFCSIGLWAIGSIILYNEKSGKAVIPIVAIIIISGLYSLYNKEQKQNKTTPKP